ncbi:MAG: ribosome maturation factor RimM [Gudongella sp.]|jgi:16S rRNA processing protein RimM|nr:ribosome maturation factor RimM [Gudongella sp.]
MGYTAIGMITNTHGVRGEVKVFPLTDDPERFFELKKAYIGEFKDEVLPVNARISKDIIILGFTGLEDINKVADFRNQYIYVLDEDRIKLEEGRFFISDLIGCAVFDTDNNLLGELSDILQGPANDVYVVKQSDTKEFMVPAVSEFIKEIDVKNKKIIVDPIEGMI